MGDLKNPASNTFECFLTFRGQKMLGVLGNVWPLQSQSEGGENTTMVFEDGRGLTISSGGAHWVSSQQDVARAIQSLRSDLKKAQENIDMMKSMSMMELPGTPTAG